MNKDEFWKFKNELYLKVTPDDITVAYKCISQSMHKEEGVGGINEYVNVLLNGHEPRTLDPDARARLMKFTEALDFQVDALELLDDANTAQMSDYERRYYELVGRYNALVDRHNDLISFVDQKTRDLNSVSPPASQTQNSTWRRILAGTLQGIVSYTPSKHIVCDTNGNISLHAYAFQSGYSYQLNGDLTSHTDCRER